MARFGRYIEHARGTIVGDQVTTRSINGRSLELGDATYSDGTGATPFTQAGGHGVGFKNYLGVNYRARNIINIPLPTSELAGAEIVSAIHHVAFVDVSWPSYSGVHVIAFHLLRVPVDMTDAIWDEYDDSANLDWGHPGAKAGVDYDSVAFGTISADSTLYDECTALNETINSVYRQVDLTTVVREAAEKAWARAQIIAIAQWASTTTDRRFFIRDGVTDTAVAHEWTAIHYLPPLSWFGLNSDGSINYGSFLDHQVADRDARILTGNPPPGGTGPTRSAGLGNATTNDLTQIAIISVRAFAEAPDRPTSRRYPRFVKVLDDATGEGYIDGATRLEPVPSFESTRYRAYVTPSFGTEDPTPLVTALGNSYGQYDRDETFLYSGDEAFIIRKEWWGLSPASVVGDEQWKFKHRKDARPSGYTQEAAEAHEMTQHLGLHDSGTFDRSQADPNKWRNVWQATVQQCDGASRVASFTSTGYGTLDRTHFRVGSSEEFVVGTVATVWDSDHVEHFIVDGTIGRADVTNPDQIIAERELTYTYGSDAHVVTGLYVGDLSARDRSSVAIAVLAGQNYIELDASLRAASGTLRVHNLTTGAIETHAYTMSGSRAVFTDASVTSSDFNVGDLVVLVETVSWCPVFFRLKPDEGADEVEQLSLVRAIRVATK